MTAAYKLILKVLVDAQVRRRPGCPFEEWHANEMEVVLHAVNLIRAPRGDFAATMYDLEQVEKQAVGHSDYTTKFALYASELALGSR